MNQRERINHLLSDYRLGFMGEYAKPCLENMVARLRFGKELSEEQLEQLAVLEYKVHNLNPVGKRMLVNGEESLVITVALPREDGDVAAYPKSDGEEPLLEPA